MAWLASRLKWIRLATGLPTFTMLDAAIAPAAV